MRRRVLARSVLVRACLRLSESCASYPRPRRSGKWASLWGLFRVFASFFWAWFGSGWRGPSGSPSEAGLGGRLGRFLGHAWMDTPEANSPQKTGALITQHNDANFIV